MSSMSSAGSVPSWTPEQRQKGWIVLSFSRTRLNLPISPCLADSYVILHRYFRTERDREHKFSILLTASLFLSCKIEDMFRPMASIFKELCTCLQITTAKLGIERTRAIFGDRDYSNQELTESEIDEICSLEVDFLNALDWNSYIELPFEYVNQHWQSVLRCAGDKQSELSGIIDLITRDVCFILCSEYYLDIPPICLAAAAVSYHLSGVSITGSAASWIRSEQERNPETFQYSIELLVALNDSLRN